MCHTTNVNGIAAAPFAALAALAVVHLLMASLLGVLGLEGREGLTDAAIRATYRALCLQHHPDRLLAKCGSPPTEEDASAAAGRFVAIQVRPD